MKQFFILLALVLGILACKKTDNKNSSSTLKISLVSPVNGGTVGAGTQVQFAWLSSSTNATVAISNAIKIVEITGDQSPEVALRTNKPIFEKDSLNELHISFPVSAGSPGFVAGKKYAWGITASQKGLISTGGTSSTSMFTAIVR